MTLYYILSVCLMLQSQESYLDPVDIETTQSTPHSLVSSHGYSHPEGLYPSPPPSPTSQLTNGGSATPGTPSVQQDVYHILMSPPYSPPTINPSQIINGPAAGGTDHDGCTTVPATNCRFTGTIHTPAVPCFTVNLLLVQVSIHHPYLHTPIVMVPL